MPGLKRLEVLRYSYRDFSQPVWSREPGAAAVDVLKDGDIAIVVEDCNTAIVKIMTASGKLGWVYYNPQRMLKAEHCNLHEDL